MRPIWALAGLCLVVSLWGTVGCYREGLRLAREQTSNLPVSTGFKPGSSGPSETGGKSIEGWVRKQALVSGLGIVGPVLALVMSVTLYRRALLRRTTPELEEYEVNARQLVQVRNSLAQEASERKRLAEELESLQAQFEQRVQERTSALAKAHARLEAELSGRRQAEKALAQQAQELGRSKDVLEMHVQARTQELQKLQRRYEHILNFAGEGIYGLDMQGRTTFVNPAAAKLTGWGVEELVGKTEEEIFFRGELNNVATLDGEPQPDRVFCRRDGSSFPVEYIRTPIMDKGASVGAVVIFKDITERKRADEALARKAAELSRSNSELEQFAYVASHDLQEPLRKIQAFGDRLKTKLEAAKVKEGRDYLERMQSAAARMQRLIDDLLTFSRVISSNRPFAAVDLGILLKEVLTDLELRIEQTKAKVEIGPMPTIEADATQMRQLLQNLISNALKFQPPDSQPVIQVQARVVKCPFAGGAGQDPDDEVCELTVQDNGIGFDEKYTDKIFAVFQRLHGRTEYEGTGVGLAVCRRITDRHGGTISARSKPGEGATFIVTLPMLHSRRLEAAA